MFPTIIFSNVSKAVEDYIQNLINTKKIHSSYIYTLAPKEKTIVIDQIRELNSLLQIRSPHVRLVRIDSFETATTEAQNAMLKLLEEKTKDNQFVLVVANIQKILPTILSRCTLVDLFVENTTVNSDLELVINSALEKPDAKVLGNPLFQLGTRDEAIELFKKIIVVLQKKIKTGDLKAALLAKSAFDLLHTLESNNLNPQLSVDSFVILLLRK